MQHALNNNLPEQLALVKGNKGVVRACLMVGILVSRIVSMTSPMPDLLPSYGITCAIILLSVGMDFIQPLQFSPFPSNLLLAKRSRLAFKIASTES